MQSYQTEFIRKLEALSGEYEAANKIINTSMERTYQAFQARTDKKNNSIGYQHHSRNKLGMLGSYLTILPKVPEGDLPEHLSDIANVCQLSREYLAPACEMFLEEVKKATAAGHAQTAKKKNLISALEKVRALSIQAGEYADAYQDAAKNPEQSAENVFANKTRSKLPIYRTP
jgi:hypothetical protein